MSRTRSELKTWAVREAAGGNTGDTAIARIEESLEDALRMISDQRHWGSHQTIHDLTTIAPYNTGTVSIAIGSTAVAGSGVIFNTNMVGQLIEFNGERHAYEITERPDPTSLTIKNAYSNLDQAGLSGASYVVLYALYDMPDNFQCLAPEEPALFDVDSGAECHEYTNMGLMQLLQATRSGAGRLQVYGLQTVRYNSDKWQLYLFPPPNSARRYQLTYFRRPGWWDGALPTSAWKETADADTDIVDWPRKQDRVLNAAIQAAVAKHIKPERYEQLNRDFYRAVEEAANMDRRRPGIIRLTRRNTILRGPKWKWGST